MILFPTRKFGAVDLFAFTFCSTVTIGVTFLPYVAEEEIRSVWLKLLVGVLPYFIFVYLLKTFITNYESFDFFKELKQSVWKWLYYFVLLYMIIGNVISTIHGMEGMVLIVKTYLLPATASWAIILIFILISGTAVSYGISAITRFVVSLVFLEFIVLIAIFYLGFSDYFKWMLIPPVMSVDILTFLKSSVSDMARYGGVIAVLAFTPYLKKGTKAGRAMGFGLLFVMIVYVSLSIVVLGTFGYEQSLTLVSPITALIQSSSTRTGLFERLDLFFLAIWMIAYFKIMIIQTWFNVFLIDRMFGNTNKHRLYLVVLLLLIFIVSISIPSYLQQKWSFHDYNILIYTLIIPTIFLLYLNIKIGRKKR